MVVARRLGGLTIRVNSGVCETGTVPLTTKTIIFVSACHKDSYRNCREPTRMMVSADASTAA